MQARDTRLRARRRVIRRRRQVASGLLLTCCTLLTLGGFKFASGLRNDDVALAGSGRSMSAPVFTTKPTGSTTTAPRPSAPKSPAGPSSAAPSSLSTPDPEVVSTGKYTRAPGSTAPRGTGTLKTYRVEVETGIGQDASAFAAAVDATLANPSSWTGHRLWTLMRVDGDAVVDFVIRLASPATVDNVCASAGLDTKSNVSCRAGAFVMINLDRWLKAVPDYGGDITLYRQYVVNHEVGHQLGYGHQACPRPGELAPVMQQQTFGLDGCVKNGWPYANGKLVTGPATS